MYNVILVDDEPRTVSALEKNIDWRYCGIRRVFQAVSMKQAIEILEREQIEIMVCDIEMPGGTGLQLLEWVREQGRCVNCIFVTCHPEFDYMRKAIQLNCYDYILKPINYEEFARVLTELVHKMEEKESDGPLENEDDREDGIAVRGRRELGEELNVELEVKRYIREHMVDNITVAAIAEEMHFNPQYLMRVFKGKTGLSIIEYMTKERIERSKKILKDTGLPIKMVAQMVGYGDYAYFTRVFSREEGMTPTQYRSRWQS